MPEITLPDGSAQRHDQAIAVKDVAQTIGDGLARAALAGKVDGRLVDLDFEIAQDSQVEIITPKSEEGLEVIRHSCAHLLAQAVKRLFPEVQVTIGPVIEHGFYYDFATQQPFTLDDFARIEKMMKDIVKENLPVSHRVVTRDEAIALFEGMGEQYKVEIIKDIPETETLTVYQQGEFVDLCTGPHVPNTGKIKAFKLMKLAGAYWRGDSNNEMLQRIYGTAWQDKDALNAHLHWIEEAEKRDHRKLGKQLDLFHTQEEAPGMVFWHPKGWQVYRQIQAYIRRYLIEANYQEVNSPQILDYSLWERSGHAGKFSDEMFATLSETRQFAIKPMNCPGHVQIYNQKLHSYRDLPLRLAEFGSCHRNEPSGTLHGIMRVRAFVQDDGHIFCTDAQLQPEVSKFMDQVYACYKDFGFEDILIKISTRPEKRVGSDEDWDRAEQALMKAMDHKGLAWEELPGEGAFYGPKIEISLKDSLGRIWQCGTMQVDYSMPGRLDASYIDEAGTKQVPVMLHRAVLGSLERFIGILIEHHAGKLPLWLSPTQVVAMSITDKHKPYAEEISKKLKECGFRVNLDLRNEKIGFKIREQTLACVPYQLIIGDKEVEHAEVAVRTQSGEDLGSMSLDAFIAKLKDECGAMYDLLIQ